MGTQDFKADVSEALKKFARNNLGQTPSVLKVSYQDAMAWHAGAGSTLGIPPFVNQAVKTYLETIPFQQSPLRCSILLLNVEDRTPTRFESQIQELRGLLADRGYEVDVENERQSDGWHLAVTSPGRSRNVVVFTNEVLADWSPPKILRRLEGHQWELVIGSNKGQRVLFYTQQGFQ
jgi:hypothetical protein